MSLQPRTAFEIPEETQRVARAAFPQSTLCLRIADALGPVYGDEQFADLGVWGSMEQKTGVRLPTGRFRRKTPNFRDAMDKVEKRRLEALHKFVAKRFYFAMILATQRFDLIDQKLRTGNEPYQDFRSTFSVKRADTLEYADCVTRYTNSRSRDYVLLGRALLLAF